MIYLAGAGGRQPKHPSNAQVSARTMTDTPVCTARDINHVAIAVSDIDRALQLYRSIFGVRAQEIEELPDQGVRAVLLRIGGSQLELIQPTDPYGGVARFIDRRGEALHHVCFEVEDLDQRLTDLREGGIELIDQTPREGLAGMIAFVHPRSTGGVLVELVDQGTARR